MAETEKPDSSMEFFNTLFGDLGHMGYLDGLYSSATAPSQGGRTAPPPPPAPPSTAPETPNIEATFSDYKGKVKYHDGTEFDADQIRNLAKQVAPLIDWGRTSGGAWSSSGESIGFDHAEASKLFTNTPTGAQQVVLDMAAHLARSGVTDVDRLALRTFYDRDDNFQKHVGDSQMVTSPRAQQRYRLAQRLDDGTYADLFSDMDARHSAVTANPYGHGRILKGVVTEEGYAGESGPQSHQRSVYMTDAERVAEMERLASARFTADQLNEVYTDADRAKYGAPVDSYLPARQFGSTATGDGATNYHVTTGPDGKLRFYTVPESTTDKDVAAAALSVLAMPVAGWAAPYLQGAMPALGAVGSKAAAGALTNAAVAGVTGGDVGKAALAGGLGGAIGAVNPAKMMGVTNPILGGAVNGGLRGLAGAAVSGGGIGRATLAGAAGGAVVGANPAQYLGIDNARAQGIFNQIASGGVRGAVSGQGAVPGMVGSAVGAGLGAIFPGRPETARR